MVRAALASGGHLRGRARSSERRDPNDPRVSHWEPALWSAKLRDIETDDNVLLLKTNMEPRHGGFSGRREQFKEIAFEYVFVLKRLGLTESVS